jgi:hypothetical protein
MSTMWAQRREALLRDCIVSPDVFHQMVERLGAFVIPYQDALEPETGQHHVHLYLQGLLSPQSDRALLAPHPQIHPIVPYLMHVHLKKPLPLPAL